MLPLPLLGGDMGAHPMSPLIEEGGAYFLPLPPLFPALLSPLTWELIPG